MIRMIEIDEFELVREIIRNADFLRKRSWPKPLCDMAVDGLSQKVWTGLGIFNVSGELISYLDYKVVSADLVEVGICVTREDYRRQGLMKILLCYLIEQYSKFEIKIGTYEHNQPMIGCIQETGFLEDFRVLNDRVDGSASIHYKRKGDNVGNFRCCLAGNETG